MIFGVGAGVSIVEGIDKINALLANPVESLESSSGDGSARDG
jgi:hypothetical protein